MVSQIENGEYNPSIDILSRIAEVLSVRLEIVIKEKINWRLIEIFDYFIKRFSKVDILKATKLSYFIDLEYQELFKRKFT
ncbi:MAG: helix-turn-helix domain-containing protein [Patescibacteria group bacterium]